MKGGEATRERLVVNFHGIGEPDGVPMDEVAYWCPREQWPAFADALADVSSQGNVQLEVTFDDGNASDVVEALPALRERGLTATFAVCAGRIGRAGYLGEADLRELRGSGMAIGSHGWSHLDLRRVDDAVLDREASGSRDRIAEASGGDVVAFALPFGSYDRRVLRALRGYDLVYSSDSARSSLTRTFVPRFSYDRGWHPGHVNELADRVPSAVRRLRDRARILAKSWR